MRGFQRCSADAGKPARLPPDHAYGSAPGTDGSPENQHHLGLAALTGKLAAPPLPPDGWGRRVLRQLFPDLLSCVTVLGRPAGRRGRDRVANFIRAIADSSGPSAVTARHSLLCEPVLAGSDNLQGCFPQCPLRANAAYGAELDEAGLCEAESASSQQRSWRAPAVTPPQLKPCLGRLAQPRPSQGICLPDRPGSSERLAVVLNLMPALPQSELRQCRRQRGSASVRSNVHAAFRNTLSNTAIWSSARPVPIATQVSGSCAIVTGNLVV
jgi:hypothetical protein